MSTKFRNKGNIFNAKKQRLLARWELQSRNDYRGIPFSLAEAENGVTVLLQRRANIQTSFMKDLRTAMNTARPRVPAAGRRAFFNAAVPNANLRAKVTISNNGVINMPLNARSGNRKLTFQQMDNIINRVNTHSGNIARGNIIGGGALNVNGGMPVRGPRNSASATERGTAILARLNNGPGPGPAHENGAGNGHGLVNRFRAFLGRRRPG